MAKKTRDQTPPLPMPIATAVWLFDNTTMSFRQIADFTGLAPMDVEAIANGDMGAGVQGRDPVAFGEILREELDRATADESYDPPRAASTLPPVPSRTKGPRYTPLSKRADKPGAIAWIVKNHAHIKDAAIAKLIGTTKPTITSIRERTHANMANITATNPAEIGLCTFADLDAAIAKAEADRPQEEDKGSAKGGGGAAEKGPVSGFDFEHFMPVRQGTQED